MNLHTAIHTAIHTSNIPSMAPMLRGPVGIGKTSQITAAAHRFAASQNTTAAVVTFHASQLSATETLGLPHFERQTLSDGSTRLVTEWSVSGIVRSCQREYEAGHQVYLFLDELFQGDAPTIKALRQLITERRLGAHYLPPGTRILAASNRVKDRAGVGAIATHMVNVLMLLDVHWNAKTDWLPWASTQDLFPVFIDWMVKHAHEFLSDEVPKDANTPFPTVRSLTHAERVIRALGTDCADLHAHSVVVEAVSGLVGVPAASSLAAHAKLTEFLPTVEDILEDPEGAKMPENRPDLHSILIHLVPQAVPNDEELFREDPFSFETVSYAHAGRIEAALTYTNRIPAEFRPAIWEAILRRTKGKACSVPAMRVVLKDKGREFLTSALRAL